MDIYGNTSGIGSGGEIFGDIDIDGDLKANEGEFNNLNVIDTLTTDVLISRESVETKDTLLHLGVDNVADTANLGTFWEYQDGVKKYGGLVRNKTTKRIRAFQNNTTQPTPTSDVSTFPLADLESNQLEVNEITNAGQFLQMPNSIECGWQGSPLSQLILQTNLGGTSRIQFLRNNTPTVELVTVGGGGGYFQTAGNIGYTWDSVCCFEFDQELKLKDKLTLGTGVPATQYELPSTRGTDGQVLKTNATGVVSWSAPPNPFNQDLNTGDVPRFVGVSSENFYASLNGVDGVNMVAETFFGPGSERIKFRHNLVATTTDLMLLSTTEVKVEVPLVTNSITCTDFICNSNLNISQFEIGDGFLFMDRSDNTIGGAGYITKKSRGTRSAPLAVSSGDTLNALIAKGYDGSAYVESASLQYKCSENWSVGNNGSNLIFDITPKTTTGRIPWFTISDDYFELGNKNAGTSYKLPVARGTFNQILQTDGLGNTAWVSRPIGEAGFINNATETTFVSANEWKICAGTYIQGTIADFSLQTNRLRYDGTLTQNFRILGSASVEKNLTGSAICRISIFTNGVDNTRSHQVQAINATANFPQHLSANAIIVLAPGDLVDIRVQNNTDDENFTVLNLQMIITEV